MKSIDKGGALRDACEAAVRLTQTKWQRIVYEKLFLKTYVWSEDMQRQTSSGQHAI